MFSNARGLIFSDKYELKWQNEYKMWSKKYSFKVSTQKPVVQEGAIWDKKIWDINACKDAAVLVHIYIIQETNTRCFIDEGPFKYFPITLL